MKKVDYISDEGQLQTQLYVFLKNCFENSTNKSYFTCFLPKSISDDFPNLDIDYNLSMMFHNTCFANFDYKITKQDDMIMLRVWKKEGVDSDENK